jgi:heme-degrading monooxygenase HmoA
MKGFREFHLLRSEFNAEKNSTLFASHTVWESKEDFVAWTKSENFRDAHKNAGTSKLTVFGHPQFEGFSSVEGA